MRININLKKAISLCIAPTIMLTATTPFFLASCGKNTTSKPTVSSQLTFDELVLFNDKLIGIIEEIENLTPGFVTPGTGTSHRENSPVIDVENAILFLNDKAKAIKQAIPNFTEIGSLGHGFLGFTNELETRTEEIKNEPINENDKTKINNLIVFVNQAVEPLIGYIAAANEYINGLNAQAVNEYYLQFGEFDDWAENVSLTIDSLVGVNFNRKLTSQDIATLKSIEKNGINSLEYVRKLNEIFQDLKDDVSDIVALFGEVGESSLQTIIPSDTGFGTGNIVEKIMNFLNTLANNNSFITEKGGIDSNTLGTTIISYIGDTKNYAEFHSEEYNDFTELAEQIENIETITQPTAFIEFQAETPAQYSGSKIDDVQKIYNEVSELLNNPNELNTLKANLITNDKIIDQTKQNALCENGIHFIKKELSRFLAIATNQAMSKIIIDKFNLNISSTKKEYLQVAEVIKETIPTVLKNVESNSELFNSLTNELNNFDVKVISKIESVNLNEQLPAVFYNVTQDVLNLFIRVHTPALILFS